MITAKPGDILQSKTNGAKVRVIEIRDRIFSGEVIDKGRAHRLQVGYKSHGFFLPWFKQVVE